MKKLFTLILAAVLTITSFAQDKTSSVSTEKNVLKVNTLSLFLGTGSVFYEHRFSENMSGQIGVGYLNYGNSGNRFSGLFLTPEFRYYPKNNAIDGMYIAPYLRYQNLTVKVDPDKATLTNIGGGLAFGRQWITNSGFIMDLFFGGHYTSASLKVKTGSPNDFNINAFDGFGVRVGFAIGFAF
jgi:hypothetical protein